KESLLTNTSPSQGVSVPRDRDEKFDWKKLLGEDLDDWQKELLEIMLFLLFPKLKISIIIPDRGSRPRAISTEIYFDSYVLFQSPKHVIRDEELRSILSDRNNDGVSKLAELVNSDKENQMFSVFAKLPEMIKRPQEDAQK